MSPTLDGLPGSLHGSMLLRLVATTNLGGLVGYARERHGKPAGVRMHGMVGLGGALSTVVSFGGFTTGDPARVAEQIVTGIGFLGAGAIPHEPAEARGLTTAASLWVTAALGMAVGTGMLLMSLVTAGLVFVLLGFGPRPRPLYELPSPHGDIEDR